MKELEPIHLTMEQMARAEALCIARKVLDNQASIFGNTFQRTPGDLAYLAEWILDGPDDDDNEDEDTDSPDSNAIFDEIANFNQERELDSVH